MKNISSELENDARMGLGDEHVFCKATVRYRVTQSWANTALRTGLAVCHTCNAMDKNRLSTKGLGFQSRVQCQSVPLQLAGDEASAFPGASSPKSSFRSIFA